MPNLSVTSALNDGRTQRTEKPVLPSADASTSTASYPIVSRRPSRPQPPGTAPHGPGSSTLAARTQALATLCCAWAEGSRQPPFTPPSDNDLLTRVAYLLTAAMYDTSQLQTRHQACLWPVGGLGRRRQKALAPEA